MAEWTPDTLEAQLMGELVGDRNATGGAVPTRLANIVQSAYERIWSGHDWNFRRVSATLSLAVTENTFALPAAFDKLDARWLDENNRRGRVAFTTDLAVFQQAQHQYGSTTGVPALAIVLPTVTEGLYRWQVHLTPTANGTYTYTYWYLRHPPAVAGAAVPLWPASFSALWHDLALARAQRAFRRDDTWKESFAAFRDALAQAISVNDEQLVSDTAAIPDATGDLANLPSVLAASSIWIA